MPAVRFQYPDAAILYCIPRFGTNLANLISCYTFFDRAAIPTYEAVSGCLSRATRVGMMRPPWMSSASSLSGGIGGRIDGTGPSSRLNAR